jgi:hypothetical protein
MAITAAERAERAYRRGASLRGLPYPASPAERRACFRGGPCDLCHRTGSQIDHCHVHLVTRGMLCPSCNNQMGHVDRALAADGLSFPDFPHVFAQYVYAGRCRLCLPVVVAQLTAQFRRAERYRLVEELQCMS